MNDSPEKVDQIQDLFSGGMLIRVDVKDIKTSGLKDTGADVTAIASNAAEESEIENVGCRKTHIPSAENGTDMASFGGVTATIQTDSHQVCWPVYMAPERDSVSIGMNVLKFLDAVIFAG